MPFRVLRRLYNIEFLIILTIYLIVCVLLLTLFFYNTRYYMEVFANEDGIIENLTFVFYFVSSCIMLYLFIFLDNSTLRKNLQRNKVFYFLFCIFFFICAMEEISWGQRIFKFNIPLIEDVNSHKETNFHNLVFFKKNHKNRLLIPNTVQLLTLSILLFVVVIPLLHNISEICSRIIKKAGFPVVSYSISFAFIVSYAMPKIMQVTMVKSRGTYKNAFNAMPETKEYLYALSFLIFTLIEVLLVWRTKNITHTPSV